MTPFWLELGLAVWITALVGLAGLVTSVVLLFVQRRRRAAEALRRAVLDQLLLAVRRGLPLPRALSVLGEELDRRATPNPGRYVLLDLLLWVPRRFERGAARWQARVVHDLAADLDEGDLRCLSRAPGGVFPDALPAVLSRAQRRGTLLPTLEELVRLDDDALRLRGEVRGQLLYPTWVLLVAVLVVGFIDGAITGKFDAILASYRVGDAGYTPAMATLTTVRRTLLLVTPLLLGAAWLGAGALVTGRGALLRHLLPGVRGVARSLERARALRLLLAHLRAGAPLPEALRALGEEGALSPRALDRALAHTAEGGGVVHALAASGVAGRADLERLPSTPGSPHELEALAALADAARRAASSRVDRIARATLPLALLLLGAITGTTYVMPHLFYHSIVERIAPW